MIKDEDLIITDDRGVPVASLNRSLIQKQGLTDEEVKEIISLHRERLSLVRLMSQMEASQKEYLKALAERVTEVDYKLQDVWGFPRNVNYHKFFTLPHCLCPKMDNMERLGTPYMIRTKDCPLHGWE
jgi:hypothetical protein